jgi:hypothetical protein
MSQGHIDGHYDPLGSFEYASSDPSNFNISPFDPFARQDRTNL